MFEVYQKGYNDATKELELLQEKYRKALEDPDYGEGFFDAVSDFIKP